MQVLGFESAQRARPDAQQRSPVRGLSRAVTLVCCLISSRAAADPAACAAAYEDGQRLMTTARLLDAAKQFRYCGSPACPDVMHAECLRFLDRVEATTPSVVVRLRPELERQASVAFDQQSARPLDGRAVPLDPGPHELRVTTPGYAPAQRRFLVAEGERFKVLEIVLQPPQRTPTIPKRDKPPAPRRQRTVVPWVVTAAVATAGATGFAYWGLRARSGEERLDDCSPNCPSARVDSVKRDYLLANVSLGVGVSGLIGMAVWYVVGASDAGRASRPKASWTPGPTPLSLALTLPL